MSLYYNTKFNKHIRDDISFEMGGIQYPSNWFQLVSKQDIVDAGFELVVPTNERQDDRFYWVSETIDKATLTYTNKPKDLTTLKLNWVQQVNQIAYSLLFTSDWMVVRAAEGTPVPQEWSDYRKAIRDTANNIRNQIDMSFDIGSFVAVVTDMQWPHDPNYIAPVEEVTPPVVE